MRLKLKPILGTVRVEGPAKGATVRLGDGSFDASCTIPCSLPVPPGRHPLLVEKKGFRTATVDVRVKRDKTITIKPDIAPITGSLVVSTDETGALIEVDGKPEGFTPAIVKVPVGKHRVRVSLPGFRAVEKVVELDAEQQERVEIALTQNEEVIAASRELQSVEDAPSSVTVISYRELRAMDYPTVAEALRGVRGVYGWDDRSYVSLGVRSLGRLGSYGNRLLVLVDGHPSNDNWLGSSYVGYDARTDLADLERVELVRGPGSVLYGTNAFSGVVNLVTRRAAHTSAEAGVSTNLDGVARARARGNLKLGKDAGAWTSVAVGRSAGRDFFFPEYVADTPPEVAGYSRDVDGFESGTVSGRVWWKFLTAQWFFHRYKKQLPAGEFETTLADPRNQQTDTRAFVEAKAEPKLSDQVSLLTRVHLNHYRFVGDYVRDPADGGVETDRFRGTWAGLEQRVVLSPLSALRLTAGAEGQLHFQVEQEARDDSGSYLSETGADGRPFQVGAAYGLVDVVPTEKVRVSVGARLDAYSTFGRSLNPRVAVITKPYDAGVLKILGGKAFRAPSIYELYYNDGGSTQIASPNLSPENIYSGEIEHTHRFSPTVTATASTYVNYVTQLIDFEGSGTQADPLQYQNSATPLVTLGGELEIRRDWRQGWMLSASYGLQQARFLKNDSVKALTSLERDPEKREVANAPVHLASFKGAVPILSRNVTASTRLSLEGPRYDRYENVGDDPQGRSKTFAIWDLVFSGFEPRWGLHWAVGVYNAFDWRYSLPVSAEFRQRALPQNGRTFLASADVTF